MQLEEHWGAQWASVNRDVPSSAKLLCAALRPNSNDSRSAGALYGTYEAFRYKVCVSCISFLLLKVTGISNSDDEQVPGALKIRYVGQTTLSSAAVREAAMPCLNVWFHHPAEMLYFKATHECLSALFL